MARWTEPTPEQEAGYRAWVASRPDVVRAIAERFEPWSLYRMKSTGQRVTLAAFNEDGTVRVTVSGDFNRVLFERSVFGVSPDDLEDCDLPQEECGSLMSSDDVTENIDALRVLGRSDLWEMDENGKAVKRVLQ